MRRHFCWLWLLTPAALLGGCDASYELAPTACDDYCRATQRADCRDDAPADCVRDCEKRGTALAAAPCERAFRARNDCLLETDPSAFACQDNKTQLPDVCLTERRALSECTAPGSGACFDQCLRQAESCGADFADCEAACVQQPPNCREATFAKNACLLNYPVECREWGEPDTRDPDHIPCYYEALGELACTK